MKTRMDLFFDQPPYESLPAVIRKHARVAPVIQPRTNMEWIPVIERLPEMPVDAEGFPISGEVLTFTSENEFAIATCHEYGEGPMWVMEGDYALYGVTHWMPLPAPPLPFNAGVER